LTSFSGRNGEASRSQAGEQMGLPLVGIEHVWLVSV
jgi:hypothetical protein